MIGPVLYLELLMGSRRGRLIFLRRIYAAWLILQFTFYFILYLHDVWRSMLPSPAGPGRLDLLASSRFAESYLTTFIMQQFGLLFLLTPAFVAGALTDEKSRGTLQYLLTTDLTTWQIVMGKFLGRMAHLGVLALAGLPMLCLMAPFAGLDVFTILALAAVALLPLLAVGAASVLASVWARQTRDAVLGLYAAGGLGWLLLWGIRELPIVLRSLAAPGGFVNDLENWTNRLDELLCYLDPLYVIEPAWTMHQDLGLLAQRLAAALVLWSALAGGCLGLAVWRLRKAYIRQLENAGESRRNGRGRARRRIDHDEPIRWKESQIEGIAPLPVLRRIPRPVGLAVTAVLISVVSIATGEFEIQAILFVLIASAVVGIRCSGTVSGEREQQTWEALLLTPLPVRDLIRNKLHGILRAAQPYLAAYAVPATAAAMLYQLTARNGFLALLWTVLSLLAVWPAMYFVGAVGVYYSVRSHSSWKSLMATIGVGYVGGLLICTLSAPLAGLGVGIVLAVLSVCGMVPRSGVLVVFALFLGIVAGWGIMLWRLGNWFLVDAQKSVVGRERTPYWKVGVNCGWAVEQYMSRWENKHA